MLDSRELLALLDEKGIPKKDIAKALGIDPAGVTRMWEGGRQLKLDEARTLVEKFELEQPRVSPLSLPVARLLILYAAETLGTSLDPTDDRVEELARDFRAFSAFATDPRVRENADAAAGFLQGFRLARDPRA